MSKRAGVIDEVMDELRRQDEKWGEQNHAPEYWMRILQEEVGEVARHWMEGNKGDYRRELIHVAAVAAQMALTYDRDAAER